MSLANLAQEIAHKGRHGDSTLVHMTPGEVAGLAAIARAHGGELTVNPETGLPEANFLKKILPALAGAAVSSVTGWNPFASSLLIGSATGLASGSLSKGLAAGLGAYSGASLAGGLTDLGAQALANQAASVPYAANLPPGEVFSASAAPSAFDKIGAGFGRLTEKGGPQAFVDAMGGSKGLMQAGLAGLAGASMMEPQKTVPTVTKQPSLIRPMVMQRQQRPWQEAQQMGGQYFDDRLTPLTPYEAAGGGVVPPPSGEAVHLYADGGSVAGSATPAAAPFSSQQIADYYKQFVTQGGMSEADFVSGARNFGVTDAQLMSARNLLLGVPENTSWAAANQMVAPPPQQPMGGYGADAGAINLAGMPGANAGPPAAGVGSINLAGMPGADAGPPASFAPAAAQQPLGGPPSPAGGTAPNIISTPPPPQQPLGGPPSPAGGTAPNIISTPPPPQQPTRSRPTTTRLPGLGLTPEQLATQYQMYVASGRKTEDEFMSNFNIDPMALADLKQTMVNQSPAQAIAAAQPTVNEAVAPVSVAAAPAQRTFTPQEIAGYYEDFVVKQGMSDADFIKSARDFGVTDDQLLQARDVFLASKQPPAQPAASVAAPASRAGEALNMRNLSAMQPDDALGYLRQITPQQLQIEQSAPVYESEYGGRTFYSAPGGVPSIGNQLTPIYSGGAGEGESPTLTGFERQITPTFDPSYEGGRYGGYHAVYDTSGKLKDVVFRPEERSGGWLAENIETIAPAVIGALAGPGAAALLGGGTATAGSSALAGALMGGTYGAGSAAVNDQNVLKGAVTGALTGAASGALPYLFDGATAAPIDAELGFSNYNGTGAIGSTGIVSDLDELAQILPEGGVSAGTTPSFTTDQIVDAYEEFVGRGGMSEADFIQEAYKYGVTDEQLLNARQQLLQDMGLDTTSTAATGQGAVSAGDISDDILSSAIDQLEGGMSYDDYVRLVDEITGTGTGTGGVDLSEADITDAEVAQTGGRGDVLDDLSEADITDAEVAQTGGRGDVLDDLSEADITDAEVANTLGRDIADDLSDDAVKAAIDQMEGGMSYDDYVRLVDEITGTGAGTGGVDLSEADITDAELTDTLGKDVVDDLSEADITDAELTDTLGKDVVDDLSEADITDAELTDTLGKDVVDDLSEADITDAEVAQTGAESDLGDTRDDIADSGGTSGDVLDRDLGDAFDKDVEDVSDDAVKAAIDQMEGGTSYDDYVRLVDEITGTGASTGASTGTSTGTGGGLGALADTVKNIVTNNPTATALGIAALTGAVSGGTQQTTGTSGGTTQNIPRYTSPRVFGNVQGGAGQGSVSGGVGGGGGGGYADDSGKTQSQIAYEYLMGMRPSSRAYRGAPVQQAPARPAAVQQAPAQQVSAQQASAQQAPARSYSTQEIMNAYKDFVGNQGMTEETFVSEARRLGITDEELMAARGQLLQEMQAPAQQTPARSYSTQEIMNAYKDFVGNQGMTEETFVSEARRLGITDEELMAAREQLLREMQAAPMAAGGIAALAAGGRMAEGHLGSYSDGGRLLRGPGDGVSDSIPASIGGKHPARLADGEFVIPARIVSELGNGSTEAGARQLYAMMDRIQKRRGKTVGKNAVAVDSKARKFLPA